MFDNLRKLVLTLNLMSGNEQQKKNRHRFMRMLLSLTTKNADNNIESFGKTVDIFKNETAQWVTADDLHLGHGGGFDACDLRHWIALSELAGVPYVPAKVIEDFTEDEISALSGSLTIADDKKSKLILSRLFNHLFKKEAFGHFADKHSDLIMGKDNIDFSSLQERIFAAMDNIPEGWMVRSNRCGASTLKALSGSGLSGSHAPEVMMAPQIEVGPGWVRVGNRRRIDVQDSRIVQMTAEGPGGCVFLARPWITADRYITADDPMRHGTQFAGKGTWPMEWRAFVENGVVVGVANYYGWIGEVSAHNAKMAQMVRKEAQKIVDTALRLKAYPRYMEVEFVRNSTHPDIQNNIAIQNMLATTYSRETVSCTLDFLEHDNNVVLLEGGPPYTPFGGGHPCAFAGVGGLPHYGNKTQTHGVAFKLMPHVELGSLRTWVDHGDRSTILSWEDVEKICVEEV